MRLGGQADNALVYHNQGAQGLDQIRRVGRDVRIIVPYQKVQALGWSPFQQAVHEARARHMRVQVALQAKGPMNRFDYAQFAAQAADRLHGVRTWSPWNEPELSGLAPAAYRSVYQLGQRVIGKRVHDARFLIGETSPYEPVHYLQQVLHAGRGRLTADGYAHHPYQFTAPPGESYGPKGYVGIGRLSVLQRELARARRQGLLMTLERRRVPLYLTEFGYQRHGSRAVSERTRERWLPRAVRQARRAGARQLLFYGVVPSPDEAWNTGLGARELRAIRAAR